MSEGPLVAVAWADGADRSVPLPAYATAGAAGADLRLNLPEADRARGLTLAPGQRGAAPTGLRLAIPEGWEGQVRMRSGLARRFGLTVPNGPGTVDADYRGEVVVLLLNAGEEAVTLRHGERIAQLVVARAPQARFALAPDLPETARGAGGFGSTGLG